MKRDGEEAKSLPLAKKKKEITLQSSDGALLYADEFLAEQSAVVRRAINSNPADISLNIPSVPESVLRLVIEFCEKQAEFTAEINVAAKARKKAKGVIVDFVDNTIEGKDAIAFVNGTVTIEKKRRHWEEEFLLVDHDVLYYLIMVRTLLLDFLLMSLVLDLDRPPISMLRRIYVTIHGRIILLLLLLLDQLQVLYVPNLSEELIVPIMQAADVLEIDSLRNLTCQKLADLIKNKSPEQIREMLGIEDDFSEEEKLEIKKELRLFWDR
ncbi:hypothetical protein OPV22_030536 [Ensete ventricosum]|uniref:SKP1 component dimerisation domain-containing protein n=1 Tax=Ensete ventricosum TaxID=4639 RepID=A0AAV8Q931_ENSVE|nr:hypothetical protein OPV22_030536 [Ensete ventricosum]